MKCMNEQYNNIHYILRDYVVYAPKEYVYIRDPQYQMAFCKTAFPLRYKALLSCGVLTCILSLLAYINIITAILVYVDRYGSYSVLLSISFIASLVGAVRYFQAFGNMDEDKRRIHTIVAHAIAIYLGLVAELCFFSGWGFAISIMVIPIPMLAEILFVKAFNKAFFRACMHPYYYDEMYGKGFYFARKHYGNDYAPIIGKTEHAEMIGYEYRRK